MRFVLTEPILDPGPYLAELNVVGRDLPLGARAFASDPDHFDFYGPRCVKDLQFRSAKLVDDERVVSLVIDFLPNPYKHEQRLRIEYTDVAEYSLSVDEKEAQSLFRLDGVRLDEVLPHQHGASHEIAFNRGRIWVVAADLVATWRPRE